MSISLSAYEAMVDINADKAARIVDLEAQVEALKADLARYESGRVALCEELAGKRELIASLERRLRAVCSHPRIEQNEANEPVCAECGLIAEESI